jgi:hypothetical protein
MVFVEILEIKIDKGIVYCIADVQDNPDPVYFRFTYLEKNSFISENPDHDVPKKITYNLAWNIMTAKVS